MNRTLIIVSIVLTAVGYFTFFVPMEGKSIASHVGDVWRSPPMQQKVKLVQEGVPRALGRAVPNRVRDYFGSSTPAPKLPKPAVPERSPARQRRSGNEEHTDKDRRALQALVDQVHKSR